jgi:hypothetical protein
VPKRKSRKMLLEARTFNFNGSAVNNSKLQLLYISRKINIDSSLPRIYVFSTES